jgi:hypothetical protein
MRMAFEFKEEFDRSRKSPLSATINIDRSHFSRIHWHRRTADIDEDDRQQREGLTAMSLQGIAASDRITASVAGDLPGISRAIWTALREAERTWRACGIRTP